MSRPLALRRRAPWSRPLVAIAALLSLLLFAATASRALAPIVGAAPPYLLDGLTAPSSFAQRTT